MSYVNRFFEHTFDTPDGHPTNPREANSHPQITDATPKPASTDFVLTDAVRPSKNAEITLGEGFRHDTYVDEASGAKVPVIMASVSKEKLFATFMRLIQRLGPVVDVVLESSHNQNSSGHADFYREHIDMPVLTSVLWDYEDLLMNDGCTGIAVLNPDIPQEIQFEEHKLLVCYGSPLEPYEFVLDSAGVKDRKDLSFVTEAEHVHASSAKFAKQFEKLRMDLGLDGSQNDGPGEDSENYGDGENYGDYGDSDQSGGLL